MRLARCCTTPVRRCSRMQKRARRFCASPLSAVGAAHWCSIRDGVPLATSPLYLRRRLCALSSALSMHLPRCATLLPHACIVPKRHPRDDAHRCAVLAPLLCNSVRPLPLNIIRPPKGSSCHTHIPVKWSKITQSIKDLDRCLPQQVSSASPAPASTGGQRAHAREPGTDHPERQA